MIQQQSNLTLIPELITQLQQEQQQAGHRQLVFIAGQQSWAIEQAHSIRQKGSLWFGLGLEEPTVTLSQAQQWLGQECSQVVINAFSQFAVDGVAAISGIIPAGGQLIILCPPLADWPSYHDPNYQQLLSYQQSTPSSSRFLSRLIAYSTPKAGLCIWQQQGGLQYVRNLHQPTKTNALEHHTAPDSIVSANIGSLSANPQQLDAINKIVKCATGRARRPLVLTADRGRGKSASLGLAAAELLEHHQKHILVCGPNRRATQAVFTFAELGLHSPQQASSITTATGQLNFIAPDALLLEQPSADVVLVDEAAAIPMAMLKTICQHYPRVVFASTQHGYEGSGRGFSLKFMEFLQTGFKNFQQLHLTQPIRWHVQDPLEQWTFTSFALNAQCLEPTLPLEPSQWRYQLLSQSALVNDEALLQQAFALLVNAHYQTRPSDLRAMLDNERISVHLVFQQQELLAVALIMDEPPLPESLTEAIHLGQRRVQGHLIAQSLSLHAGAQPATQYRYARVLRIAVSPVAQSHGVGSWLLEHIFQWSQQQGMDFLGSSFGFTADLASFWQQNDFQLCHMGLSRDVASGCYSVIALRSCQPALASFCNQLTTSLSRQLQDYLTGPLNQLAAETVAALISWLKCNSDTLVDNQPDNEQVVTHYCNSHRPIEFALPAIRHWLWQLPTWPQLDPQQTALLIQRCLQQRNWQQVVSANQLNGKKAAEAQLKLILQQVLQDPNLRHH